MTSPSAPASSALPRMVRSDAGHLEADQHGLVAADQFGLHQVGWRGSSGPAAAGAWRRSRARLLERGRGVGSELALRAALDHDVGGAEDFALTRAAAACIAASTVSLTVPVKRSGSRRATALPGSSKVTSKRPSARRRRTSARRRARPRAGSTWSVRTSWSKVTARFLGIAPGRAVRRARAAMRASMSLAVMVRLARVTAISARPRVSRPNGCGAAAPRRSRVAAGTVPVWPRSGARKIATSATAPAFSIRSPMRTISLVTMASRLSAGAVDLVERRELRRGRRGGEAGR